MSDKEEQIASLANGVANQLRAILGNPATSGTFRHTVILEVSVSQGGVRGAHIEHIWESSAVKRLLQGKG